MIIWNVYEMKLNSYHFTIGIGQKGRRCWRSKWIVWQFSDTLSIAAQYKAIGFRMIARICRYYRTIERIKHTQKNVNACNMSSVICTLLMEYQNMTDNRNREQIINNVLIKGVQVSTLTEAQSGEKKQAVVVIK